MNHDQAYSSMQPDENGVWWVDPEYGRRYYRALANAERDRETRRQMERDTAAWELWERVNPGEPNPMGEEVR